MGVVEQRPLGCVVASRVAGRWRWKALKQAPQTTTRQYNAWPPAACPAVAIPTHLR